MKKIKYDVAITCTLVTDEPFTTKQIRDAVKAAKKIYTEVIPEDLGVIGVVKGVKVEVVPFATA